MPEITIKYEKPETLTILRAFAKYFDFRVLSSRAKKKTDKTVNGVTIIPADLAIDTSEMETIFSGRKMDATELRNKVWQRQS